MRRFNSIQGSARPDSTPAQKLEQVHARVKSALHAAEDGNLHPAIFDEIAQPLVLALRALDELTITITALSRATALTDAGRR